MILDQLSSTLQKALPDGNSQKEVFVDLDMTDIEPGTNLAANPSDLGVFPLGYGGAVTVQQILILPFAQGEPGAEFWMRVYGWRLVGQKNALDKGNRAPTWLWIPTLLAELTCRTCARNGRPFSPTGMAPPLLDTEYACDTIGVTAGYAMVAAPGRNLIAWFTVPTLGCQKVQFDFMIGEEVPAFPNALWARA